MKAIISTTIIVCVIALVTVGYCALQDMTYSMAEFEARATAYLGTDNFTITDDDGWLQAETPDGLKYPTDADMDKAYIDYMTPRLITIGALCLVAFPIIYVTYKYSTSVTQQEAKK